MRILFTICGRAGSKGFRNKNLKRMNGIPLVYYTISPIRLYADAHTSDDIMVALNTDSTELIDLVREQSIYPDIKIVDRKPELAGDHTPKVDVIRDTYLSLSGNEGFDAVIDLDITSPLRSAGDIDKAVKEYLSTPDYDLVFSVVEGRRNPYFNMVERRYDFYHKVCDSGFTARQEAPSVYELNASIYVYAPGFLEQHISDTILDHRCGISVMKDYLVLDIDSEDDFMMMEYLHRHYCDTDAGIRAVYEMACSGAVDIG